MKHKSIVFNGKTNNENGHGYYRHRHPDGHETVLHRDIWESVNGKIPDGCDIHHKDFNKANNDISNLLCLTKHEHQMLHGRTEIRIALGRKVAEWGRGKPELRRKKVCKRCGKEFDGVPCQIFCSQFCAYDWHNHNRKAKYKKICCICGKEFMTPHKVVTTCCNTCTQKKKSILAKEYARKKDYKIAD